MFIDCSGWPHNCLCRKRHCPSFQVWGASTGFGCRETGAGKCWDSPGARGWGSREPPLRAPAPGSHRAHPIGPLSVATSWPRDGTPAPGWPREAFLALLRTASLVKNSRTETEPSASVPQRGLALKTPRWGWVTLTPVVTKIWRKHAKLGYRSDFRQRPGLPHVFW